MYPSPLADIGDCSEGVTNTSIGVVRRWSSWYHHYNFYLSWWLWANQFIWFKLHAHPKILHKRHLWAWQTIEKAKRIVSSPLFSRQQLVLLLEYCSQVLVLMLANTSLLHNPEWPILRIYAVSCIIIALIHARVAKWLLYCDRIRTNVDFDPNPITITFSVGEVNKRVNISVSCDEEVEGDLI